MNEILAPVSPGELIDKLTILQIKSRRITDATKLANVRRELEVLTRCWRESPWAETDIRADEAALLAVNERLDDYQHLHPEPGRRPGEWRFAFTPRGAGDYRFFADFTPAATAFTKCCSECEPRTNMKPRPLPSELT